MACNNDGGDNRTQDKCDKTGSNYSTAHFIIPDADINEDIEDAVQGKFVVDLYGNLDIAFIQE